MSIADLLFPKYCLECSVSGDYMCRRCLEKLEYSPSICPMCTKPSIDGITHVSCKKPHGLDGLTSLWKYTGVIKKTIQTFKFKYATDISDELVRKFIINIKKADKPLPVKGILVPIPLHANRKKWRGFNQSEEIGERISKKIGWEYASNLLTRRRNGIPQSTIKDKEFRLKNTRGIFELKKDISQRNLLLSQENVFILFDDVWTTGATMREAGKVLKRNGVESVWGLTLAH